MTTKKHRALSALLASQWAILPDTLELMAEIAEREHEYAGNLEALEAKLGRPLGNTMTATVRDGVASIPVEGPLFKRASFFAAMSGATDYTTIATDLNQALDNPGVRAVMLVIDSPGGEVTGTAELAAMIRGASKPVWAYIEGTGASAAYWLAAAGARVIASPTAVIGSIGVQVGYTAREPRAGEKTYRFVSSQSPLKNVDPATDAGAQQVQQMVDGLASVFIATVAEYRGVSEADVLAKFGQGGVFVAQAALDRGMIDAIATQEQALAELQKELNAMDYASLTASALSENRPDLVAAIRTEALAGVQQVDAAAIRAEAAAAERARILAIEALAVPGAESVIAACKADGTDEAKAAILVVQHMRTAQQDKGAAALAAIKGAEPKNPPAPLPSANDYSADPAKDGADATLELARAHGVVRAR